MTTQAILAHEQVVGNRWGGTGRRPFAGAGASQTREEVIHDAHILSSSLLNVALQAIGEWGMADFRGDSLAYVQSLTVTCQAGDC